MDPRGHKTQCTGMNSEVEINYIITDKLNILDFFMDFVVLDMMGVKPKPLMSAANF